MWLMLEWLLLLLAIAGVCVACYTDLRSGIVPNRLSFPLFAAGIAGNLVAAAASSDLTLLRDLVVGVAATFALGYLLWLGGVLAGGDVKVFLFISALLPRYPHPLEGLFSPSLAWYPFPVSVMLNSFLAAFPFVLLYAIAVGGRRISPRKVVRSALNRKTAGAVLVLLAAFSVSRIAGTYAALGAVLFLVWLRSVSPAYATVASGGLAASGVLAGVSPRELLGYSALGVGMLVLVSLAWHSLNELRVHLRREVRIEELKEGMIPAEEIYIREGKIIRKEAGILEKIMNALSVREEGAVLVSAGAGGLSAEQISELRRLVKEGRLEDRLLIRRRMPFAPVMLAGLVIALVSGDVLVRL